ncbi:LPXTG cell wall anchor domain-containing protein [Streptococcus sp. Marseille-Q7087]
MHDGEKATHRVPEFTGGVNGSAPTTGETPVYRDEQSQVALALSQDKTYQAPASRQHILPETGTKENATLSTAGFVGMILGLFAIGKKKDQD